MRLADPDFASPEVAARFAAYPAPARAGLLRLRALIFEVAERTPGVGRVEECLKWGQPAYPTAPKTGSPLRLGVPKSGGYAIYAHCQTSIISDFRSLFPRDFTYEGNRAVIFAEGEDRDTDKLRLLISSALTYHVKRKATAP